MTSANMSLTPLCLSLLQKNDSSLLQSHINVFAEKSKANGMELKKTKRELKISFSTSNKRFYPMVINNKKVEVVTVVELLRVTLSNYTVTTLNGIPI